MRHLPVLLLAILSHFVTAQTPISIKGRFTISGSNPTESSSYTLTQPARTSAGVYNGGTLIKTLWDNETKAAGVYPFAGAWDGTDNEGTVVPDGAYSIKVVENNVTYNWDGVVGNTSTNNTGATVHHPPGGYFYDMKIVGSKAIYVIEYYEGHPSEFSFNTSAPNQRIDIQTNYDKTRLISSHVCTDGTNVYFSGIITDYFLNPRSFTYARNVSTNAEVTFSSGVTVQPPSGPAYASAIDFYQPAAGNNYYRITGNTVQKTGNYLFVSRGLMNRLHVLNKTTGALVQTITTIANPGYMDTDLSNNLWLIAGTTCKKYAVNSDGSLGSVLVNLSGLEKPLSVNVSPDGAKIAVTDAGTSQQVKFFSNSTGALISTQGTPGGYTNSPDVTTNKFQFRDSRGFVGAEYPYDIISYDMSFVTFDPNDNSYWVCDPGTMRMMHYTSTGVYIDQIMTQGYHYSASIDPNDPTRVFCNYQEFQVDYAKPLLPNNGSWTLVKNWGNTVSGAEDNQYRRLKDLATIGGKKFCLNGMANNNKRVYEFTSTGLRNTGIVVGNNTVMQPNGDLWTYNKAGGTLQDPTTWKKQASTGLDGNSNPTWSGSITMASVVGDAKGTLNDGAAFHSNQITATGVLNFFDSERGQGYHLGGIDLSSPNAWKYRAAPATYLTYEGQFPTDGAYDTGNGVLNGGADMYTVERSTIWNYRGEFWKSSQCNYFTHVLDNGLTLGRFGTYNNLALLDGESPAGMAGNAFMSPIVKVSGKYYFYTGDESHHSALHRWSVGNLASIKEYSYGVIKSGTLSLATPGYVNLMAGLPKLAALTGNVGGWTFSPALNANFTAQTGLTTYQNNQRSLRIKSGGATYVASCTLGTVNAPNWTISGELGYPDAGEHTGNIIRVLDNTGKTLLELNRLYSYPTIDLKANGTTLVTGSQDVLRTTIGSPIPISIRSNGANIFVKYGTYPELTLGKFDSSANLNQPASVQVRHEVTDTPHTTDVANLRLYTN